MPVQNAYEFGFTRNEAMHTCFAGEGYEFVPIGDIFDAPSMEWWDPASRGWLLTPSDRSNGTAIATYFNPVRRKTGSKDEEDGGRGVLQHWHKEYRLEYEEQHARCQIDRLIRGLEERADTYPLEKNALQDSLQAVFERLVERFPHLKEK